MNTFAEYLKNNYKKTITQNRIEYCFQNVPSSLTAYYENKSKERKLFWTPQSLGVISHSVELTAEKIQEIQNDVAYIKNTCAEDLMITIESVPDWYYEFIKRYYELSIFRESISFSSFIAQNTICMKPNCLDGKFFIGQYAGITPLSCPIFTNENGEIFVYDAKNFRNYPKNDSVKEMKRYMKQEVPLIAYWENIELYLIEECERLQKMFTLNPSIYSIKNCAPHNI